MNTLDELKQEYDAIIRKLQELDEDELLQVTGGITDQNSNINFIADELGILPNDKD